MLVSCHLFKKGAASPSAPVNTNSHSSKTSSGNTAVKLPDNRKTSEENRVEPIPLPDDPVRAVISPEMYYELQFKYAILLDVPVEEMLDHRLIEFLESWYGTRYRMGGTDRSGVDCSAFVQSFMTSMYGIAVPRTSREQFDEAEKIKKSELQEGDLVFFRTQRRRGISHVGIYLRNNKFVHASTSSGVMISDLSENYFDTRYAGSGRYKKM